jgi:hypothetical protein
MALTAERKRQLATMTLASDSETIARAIAFEQRAGLTRHEFCQAIGYSSTTLGVYLNGKYELALSEDHDHAHNSLNIRAALKEFMDKWEGRQALSTEREPHRTADFKAIVESSLNALDNGSAYVIDGPPGTQKTFSLRAVEREIGERVGRGRVIYLYARADHAPLSFLREICNTAGIPNRGDIDKVIRKIRFFLGEQRILLMVDEAQHLPHKSLEVLRQLLDLPPYFGVVLAGSHDLSQRLSHWQMEQWRSRVRKTLYLNGPSLAEARGIVRAELEPVLGAKPDTVWDSLIDGCWASASRIDRSTEKAIAKKFNYISARDLFFTIAGIQQRAGVSQQKVSIA